MSYVTAHAPCFACGYTFAFNPHKVPSFPVDGERQPVCRTCMGLVNERRVASGLNAFDILPGAYEPMPAEEL